MPRLVIIIPDWDMLKYMGEENCNYGIGEVSKKLIEWMMCNLNRAVKTRKDELTHIKLGAVVPDEPKFVWVKMINRAHVSDHVLAVRHKLNNALEAALTN